VKSNVDSMGEKWLLIFKLNFFQVRLSERISRYVIVKKDTRMSQGI